MFLDWNDIKKLRGPRQVVEITATLRMDRIFFTPNGPVAYLRKGENLIEMSWKSIGEVDPTCACPPAHAPGAPAPRPAEPLD